MKANDRWVELADSGRYKEAIGILQDSILKSKHKDRKIQHWHIGQLFACNGEYESAVENLKKSTGIVELFFDREWRLYYKGTIAFLNKDKQKLSKYTEKLWHHHSAYYDANACRLKMLYENFDMPYNVAYNIPCK